MPKMRTAHALLTAVLLATTGAKPHRGDRFRRARRSCRARRPE